MIASEILTVADIVTDPTYAERDDVLTVDDPQLGPVRMQGVVPKLHRHGGSVWRTGPELGADDDVVLGDWLGMPAADVARLRGVGVVGPRA